MFHTSKVFPSEALSSLLATYDPSKNVSVVFMTKFERTTVLGVRMEQLAQGSPPVLTDEELKGLTSTEAIAEKELSLKKIPFVILRTLPSGRHEIFKIEDMVIS